MESVEELCDYIALINHSKLVVTGELEQIRKEYGNDDIELIYSDSEGTHQLVLPKENNGTLALEEYLKKGVNIVSYRELIPRMNDIFIKLVKGEE